MMKYFSVAGLAAILATASAAADLGAGALTAFPATQVCAGTNIPDNFVVIDFESSATRCGGYRDNIWVLQDLSGLGVGSQVKMCASQPHPGNWSVINTETRFSLCESGGYRDNIAVIQRLR